MSADERNLLGVAILVLVLLAGRPAAGQEWKVHTRVFVVEVSLFSIYPDAQELDGQRQRVKARRKRVAELAARLQASNPAHYVVLWSAEHLYRIRGTPFTDRAADAIRRDVEEKLREFENAGPNLPAEVDLSAVLDQAGGEVKKHADMLKHERDSTHNTSPGRQSWVSQLDIVFVGDDFRRKRSASRPVDEVAQETECRKLQHNNRFMRGDEQQLLSGAYFHSDLDSEPDPRLINLLATLFASNPGGKFYLINDRYALREVTVPANATCANGLLTVSLLPQPPADADSQAATGTPAITSPAPPPPATPPAAPNSPAGAPPAAGGGPTGVSVPERPSHEPPKVEVITRPDPSLTGRVVRPPPPAASSPPTSANPAPASTSQIEVEVSWASSAVEFAFRLLDEQGAEIGHSPAAADIPGRLRLDVSSHAPDALSPRTVEVRLAKIRDANACRSAAVGTLRVRGFSGSSTSYVVRIDPPCLAGGGPNAAPQQFPIRP